MFKKEMAMEENEELKISYKNYDMVIKDALTLFENKTLDFLGLDLPKIISVEDSELYKIETKNNFIDLIFMLEDGTLLHIEEEAHVSSKDLLRFAQTDLMLYSKKHSKIRTVVLTKQNTSMKTINAGSFDYQVTVLNLAQGNWEEEYNKLKTLIEQGKTINELELIFLPLKKIRRRKRNIHRSILGISKTDKNVKRNESKNHLNDGCLDGQISHERKNIKHMGGTEYVKYNESSRGKRNRKRNCKRRKDWY
jgi:hypothetical protein